MAHFTPPYLEITSAQPGYSKIKVIYMIMFDNNDRAVNQTYDERVDIIGVDEPAPNSQLGMVHWYIRPDMEPYPGIGLTRVHEWTSPNWSLDEDSGPNLDEIRADVTLVPQAPSVGPFKSNVVQLKAA